MIAKAPALWLFIIHFFCIFTVAFDISDSVELVVSNYPEKITKPGHLANVDIHKRPLRLLYYHENDTSNVLNIHLYLMNPHQSTVSVRYISAVAGPDTDGLYAGHVSTRVFFDHLRQQRSNLIDIPPRQQVRVLNHRIKPGMVSAGLLQFQASDRMIHGRLMVEDPRWPQFTTWAHRHYAAGTFASGYQLIHHEYIVGEPMNEQSIGDEPFLLDPINGISLKGNYGVIYDIAATIINPYNAYKTVELLVSPSAGITRGVFLINDGDYELPLLNPNKSKEAYELYEIHLLPKQEITMRIITMPQAGSYYPIRLVFRSRSL